MIKGTPNKKIPEKVAIFAPSHLVSNEEIMYGMDELEKAGFSVNCPVDLIAEPINGCKWANTAEERTRRIINILNDPTIDAMWAVNGGESAIEVVNLLNEYNKNPNLVKEQIKHSYLSTHESLPDDFFLPERPDLFDYSQGALPKRGIYCIGFSDVSGINNFLGQRGIVSPYYADVLGSGGRDKTIKHLRGEEEISKYGNLTLLGGEEFSTQEPLEIYATVEGWIASSCGTEFQFALKKPSILAIESIEEGNVVGLTLQQALEAGGLENVKAIVIGRISGGEVGNDLEKYPTLKEFVEKSGISVFTTNRDSETEVGTFGHGKGGISEPFANFAKASLSKQGDGKYSLEINGQRTWDNINDYYESQQPEMIRTQIFSDHPRTVGDISLRKEDLQPIKGQHNLDGSEFVNANYRELRSTNGTTRQVDLKDKVLIVSCNDGSNDDKEFLHHSLVENYLSGSLAGAKAIVIAIPSYQQKDMPETLAILTHPSLSYESPEQDMYLLRNLPKQVFDSNLKPDLDRVKEGGLKYEFNPEGGIVTIKITDENLVDQTRRELYDKPFKEILANAATTYFPNIPIYLTLDDKLVRNIKDGMGSGELSLDLTIDALDLHQHKPSSSPEKSYAEKLIGKTIGGANEI